MIEIGNIDFIDFLRIQCGVMMFLLVVQGVDYIFGIGVNFYLFIIFCIVFAFTLGSVYFNIIITNKTGKFDEKLNDMEEIMACNCEDINLKLMNLEEKVDFLFDEK